ncbi:hypothetical protein B0T14DRAFT_515871 [Immersiella caudata]|uniref:Uncharacterized protein n=1 Tax=Immersiella caudata TaxID=314043 RepID=A0AA39WXE9_9PEZI|nr:hypothetical protein B0T14DRAFT_515871 [Immersiella caudata]
MPSISMTTHSKGAQRAPHSNSRHPASRTGSCGCGGPRQEQLGFHQILKIIRQSTTELPPN